MSPFEVYDAGESPRRGRRSGKMRISVDKMGRLYLSKALQEYLGCVNLPIRLYVGYDKVNKRIGIAKPDVVRIIDKEPMKFDDKRSYASARGFLEKHKIPHDKTYHYDYDGKEDGWLTFRLSGYVAPDERNIVRIDTARKE